MDPRAIADLARSGLTVKDFEIELPPPNGFTDPEGYTIVYRLPDGTRHPTFWRKRLFAPLEDGSRYTQVAAIPGPSVYPYFHKDVDWLATRSQSIKYIVEGEKKAASALKHFKLPAIGIGGCWNWSGEATNKLRHPIHDAFLIVIKPGDIVRCVFDGDFRDNRQVEWAMAEIRLALLQAGAIPEFIELPINSPRLGLDDWIVTKKPSLYDFSKLPATDGIDFRESIHSQAHRLNLLLNRNELPAHTPMNLKRIMAGSDFLRKYMYFNEYNGFWYTRLSDIGKVGPKFREFQQADYMNLLYTLDNRALPGLTKKTMVQDLVEGFSHSGGPFTRNPVLEYFDSLTWDKKERIKAIGPELLYTSSAPDDILYAQQIMVRWFIGMVARAYEPGCRNDTMLVLIGPQGFGKTRFFSIIGGEWYRETTVSMSKSDGADFKMSLDGKLIVDLSELGSFRRTEMEHAKAILSITHDDYRRPYARAVESHPRRGVIVGTTNDAYFLSDQTGNRRFHPLVCGVSCPLGKQAELATVQRERDNLFAEAVYRYKAGERWHVDGDMDGTLQSIVQAKQHEHMQTSGLGLQIAAFLDDPLKREWISLVDGVYPFVRLLTLARGIGCANQSEIERVVHNAHTHLKALGWRKIEWLRPDQILNKLTPKDGISEVPPQTGKFGAYVYKEPVPDHMIPLSAFRKDKAKF